MKVKALTYCIVEVFGCLLYQWISLYGAEKRKIPKNYEFDNFLQNQRRISCLNIKSQISYGSCQPPCFMYGREAHVQQFLIWNPSNYHLDQHIEFLQILILE